MNFTILEYKKTEFWDTLAGFSQEGKFPLGKVEFAPQEDSNKMIVDVSDSVVAKLTAAQLLTLRSI